MSQQLVVKTRDLIIKRALVPTTAVIEFRGRQCRRSLVVRKQPHCKIPQHTLQSSLAPLHPPPSDIVYFGPVPAIKYDGNRPITEHCLTFGGERSGNDPEKALALSTMYVNILREMPKLLDIHDYSIYCDDLKFLSVFPILPTVHGSSSYQLTLKTWFNSLKLLYTDIYIDIISISKDNDLNTVEMRWGINGQNRINSLPARPFDGMSTFSPDEGGKIQVHLLDKVQIDKSKMFSVNPIG